MKRLPFLFFSLSLCMLSTQVAVYGKDKSHTTIDLIGRLLELDNQIYDIAVSSSADYCDGYPPEVYDAVQEALVSANNDFQQYFDTHTEIDPIIMRKAFLAAAMAGNAETIKIFLKAGCEIDGRGDEGETPAMMAALDGNVSTLQELLDQGADMYATCNTSKALEDYAVLLTTNPHCGPLLLSAAVRCKGKESANCLAPFHKCLELIRLKKSETSSLL